MSEKSKGTKEYWSMTEGVFNCLIDKKRTLAFKKAIQNTVKIGDTVVDMGTGSGILAMIAADAGASKVYAVENDENNIKTLKKTFEINGFGSKIILIKGDARKVKLPEKIDVIIGEMIATGLIEEQQIPAMNNMLRFAKKKHKVLLKAYENYLDLVNSNDLYYGHKMKIVRYEYTGVGEVKSDIFSDKKMYNKVDFSKTNKKNKVNVETVLKVRKNGKINGVRISSKTIFYDNSEFNHSFAYSYPIILPVDDIFVAKGDKFLVKLKYDLCGGLNKLKYLIVKI